MAKLTKILIIFSFALALNAYGDQVRWKSTWVDNNWFTTGNWDTSAVPGQNDFAFIERAVGVVLNGGSPVVDQLLVGGSGDPNSSITISSGEVFTTNYLKIAEYAGTVGDVIVDGGSVVINNTLRMSRADDAGCIAYLKINGGSVETNSIILDELGTSSGYGSFIDITSGYLSINGDRVSDMFDYVYNGRLTGYGSPDNVRIKYNSGKTFVYADDPGAALGTVQVRYHYAFEDDNWFNPMNWDVSNLGGGYRVPRLIDFAFIDRNVNAKIENGTAEVYDMFMGENLGGQSYEVVLTVGEGGVLNITRILAIAEHANSNATLIAENGGEVNIIGSLRMSRNDSANCFAKIIVNDGGSVTTRNLTFDQNGQQYGYGSTIELNGTGTFTRAFNRVSETNQDIANGIYIGNGVLGAVVAEYDGVSNTTIVRAATEEEMNESIWLRWKTPWQDEDWFNLGNWALHGGSPGSVIRNTNLTDYVFIDATVDVKIDKPGAKAQRVYMGESSQAVLTVEQGGTLEVAENMYVARYDNSNATLKVDGGSVKVGNILFVSENNCIGHIELISGEIECNRLWLDAAGGSSGASVNIQNGVIRTNFNRLSEIEGYIGDGRITGFGDSDLVNTQLLDDRLWIWASDPNSAHNPSPANNSMWLSPSSVTVGWGSGASATNHKVYFGSDEILADINKDGEVDFDDLLIFLNDWLLYTKTTPDWNTDFDNNGIVDLRDFAVLVKNMGSDLSSSFKGIQTETSYYCGNLDYNTWYYWRVDEITPSGTIAGDVWRFKTAYDEQSVGVPIKWTADTPDYEQPAAGLDELTASHYNIHSGAPVGSGGSGLINHFAFIHKYNGYYLASWVNHADTFDAAGKRVLYSRSSDGENWDSALPLIDSLSAMGDYEADGYVSYNQWFKEIGDKLYSVVKVRRKASGWAGDYYIARAFSSTAVAEGEPFWLEEQTPPDALGNYDNLTDLESENPELYQDAIALLGFIENYHSYYGPFASYGERVYMTDTEGNLLFEPAFYTRPDGTEVMLGRAGATFKRLFATERIAGALWLPAVETNVQDAPSLSFAGNLPDGTCYMIGNHVEHTGSEQVRDPLTIALSDDGVYFDRAFAVRTTPYPKNYESVSRVGCQYPNAIVDDGYLWVAYSVHAQDIAISKIALTELE